MIRRAFLRTLTLPFVARFIPRMQPPPLTYEGINRATFIFWRNQHVGHGHLTMEAMRRAYDACQQVIHDPPRS